MTKISPRTAGSILAFSSLLILSLVIAVSGSALASPVALQTTPEPAGPLTETMRKMLEDRQPVENLNALSATPCVGGMAGSYPCSNIDLLSFLPLADIGGGGAEGADIWGWTDSLDGKEYALMARTDGTAFVDISDPENPLYLGKLPTQTFATIWRDVKVYADHAYIVADNAGSHGMQVFDLTQLRSVVSPPVTFSNTALYTGIGSAHNVVINEDTGYAYAVGASSCSGGLHMIDITTPASPSFAGCFSADGYTHDAMCIVYNGPDAAHQGSEICFNSNEDTLTVVDVTNKSTPVQLSRVGYTGNQYAHQGWITDDHQYFLLDDELDESNNGHNTRTYIWDVTDLDNPSVIGNFTNTTAAIDHNLYLKDNLAFQANYRAGLRILDISDIAVASLSEIGYFDIYPSNDLIGFNGAWSVYPYFDSGVIIVSGIEQGLFILQPNLPSPGVHIGPGDRTIIGSPGETITHTFAITNATAISDTFSLDITGDTWPTSGPANTGSLDPGESTEVDVVVTIPDQPTRGGGVTIGSDTFTLTVTSDTNSGTNDAANGTTLANVNPGVITSAPQLRSGIPGAQISYTFTVTNTGDYTDTFTMSDSGLWATVVSPGSVGPLGPGEYGLVGLTVSIPMTTTGAIQDTTILTATSQLDAGVNSSTTATTIKQVYQNFLPVMRRD